jgi:hypothetical protein
MTVALDHVILRSLDLRSREDPRRTQEILHEPLMQDTSGSQRK